MKDKLASKQRLLALAGVLIVLTSFGCQENLVVQSAGDKRSQITAMYRQYAREFPQVKGISVDKLQQLRKQDKNIVLVDVRSPEERAVSMIPGAISREEFEENLEQYRDRHAVIVAYCTIGYRSGRYANKLRERGINILNLEGSLLAWSHVGGKLIDDRGSTKKVHVFGRQWQLTADNYQPVW